MKAVELLYMMLYHSEQDIVMHTEKVLNCLITAARDEEETVKSWTRKCSVVLGFMLHPDIWVPFMIQRLREDPSSHQILVLAGLVNGSDPLKLSEEQMGELVDILVDDDTPFWEFIDGMNESKHQLLKNHTFLVTRHFDERVKAFVKNIIMGPGKKVPIKYYNHRVEFQARGKSNVLRISMNDFDSLGYFP